MPTVFSLDFNNHLFFLACARDTLQWQASAFPVFCGRNLCVWLINICRRCYCSIFCRGSGSGKSYFFFEDSVISAALFRIYFLLFTAYCPLCQCAKEVEKCKCTLAAIHFTKLPQTIFCANNREYNDIPQC